MENTNYQLHTCHLADESSVMWPILFNSRNDNSICGCSDSLVSLTLNQFQNILLGCSLSSSLPLVCYSFHHCTNACLRALMFKGEGAPSTRTYLCVSLAPGIDHCARQTGVTWTLWVRGWNSLRSVHFEVVHLVLCSDWWGSLVKEVLGLPCQRAGL